LQILALAMCKEPPLFFSSTTLIVVDNRSSSHDSPRVAGPAVSEMRVRSGPIPLNGMEVTMRMECGDEYPMSQMTRGGSYISADQQVRYKAHEGSLDVGVESDPEKRGKSPFLGC
jgi:hypothetical protein